MPDVKKHKSAFCRVVSTVILLSAAFFIASAIVVTDYKQRFFEWKIVDDSDSIRSKTCEDQIRPYGTEALPRGIVSSNSDLEMRPLWGPLTKKNSKSSMNLLAMAVGIKQKESVNKIINKFATSNFAVMLFHYDGIVNDWREFEWSDRTIHVSAIGQTKWWFAKRFLHPDIVSEYAYIFLWDEDLGVENFDAGRYIQIIKEEGLEISQPGLDPDTSDVHHHLTARNSSSKVHRRIHRSIGGGRKCNENSTGPPCTGWVEMMAPVFSRKSWRCVWHMIQNDLVHAWGLDFQLGYCAQGDRTKNIGVVDSEYIIHYGLPTLGGSMNETIAEASGAAQPSSNSETLAPSPSQHPHHDGIREEVRKRSYVELDMFKNRWKNAVKRDECWIDPFQ